jgi:hypothetical protein
MCPVPENYFKRLGGNMFKLASVAILMALLVACGSSTQAGTTQKVVFANNTTATIGTTITPVKTPDSTPIPGGVVVVPVFAHITTATGEINKDGGGTQF